LHVIILSYRRLLIHPWASPWFSAPKGLIKYLLGLWQIFLDTFRPFYGLGKFLSTSVNFALTITPTCDN